MSAAVFCTEIPTTGVLTDNHRAVVWSLAAATQPLPVEKLAGSLDIQQLPCGDGEHRRIRAWLTEIIADLHQAGLVEIAFDGRREHLPSRHLAAAAAQEPSATIEATGDGIDLAAVMFIE